MSSSWNKISGYGSQEDGGVRFENITCSCGRKARVKIAETMNNKGRLYYLCERSVCGTFLGWAKPSHPVANEVTSQGWVSKGLGDFKKEIMEMMLKMEKEVQNLKNVGQICLVLLFVLLFVVVSK